MVNTGQAKISNNGQKRRLEKACGVKNKGLKAKTNSLFDWAT